MWGHLRFWTFLKKQILDLLKKLWTFQYAAGFRGACILVKRSTIVDLSVYAAWLRGPDISQNINNYLKEYPKIDYRAFAFSRRHYAADNRTARDIQNVGPFWVVKIQGGQCPLAPLIKYPCPSLRVRSLIQMEFHFPENRTPRPKPAYAHAWHIILNNIRQAIDTVCPLKEFKINKLKDEWITNEILELKDKDGALARANRTGSLILGGGFTPCRYLRPSSGREHTIV